MTRQYIVFKTHLLDRAENILNEYGKQGYRLARVLSAIHNSTYIYIMEKTEPEVAKREDLEEIIL